LFELVRLYQIVEGRPKFRSRTFIIFISNFHKLLFKYIFNLWVNNEIVELVGKMIIFAFIFNFLNSSVGKIMIRLAWLLLAMTLLTNGWPTAIKSQVREFLLLTMLHAVAAVANVATVADGFVVAIVLNVVVGN